MTSPEKQKSVNLKAVAIIFVIVLAIAYFFKSK